VLLRLTVLPSMLLTVVTEAMLQRWNGESRADPDGFGWPRATGVSQSAGESSMVVMDLPLVAVIVT
jgi:hypothetical protein